MALGLTLTEDVSSFRHNKSQHSLSSLLYPITSNISIASVASSLPFPVGNGEDAAKLLSKPYPKNIDWMVDLSLRTPYDMVCMSCLSSLSVKAC
jgi:hypothetical protein